MKKISAFLVLLSISSSAFAGPKEDLVNAMFMVNVEQKISTVESGKKAEEVVTMEMSNVQCSIGRDHQSCTLKTPITSDTDESVVQIDELKVVGSTAGDLYHALVGVGFEPYDVRTGKLVRASSVTCKWAFEPQQNPTEDKIACELRK